MKKLLALLLVLCLTLAAASVFAEEDYEEDEEFGYYPDEYPELGSDITVAGVFDMYTENMGGQEVRFIQLIDAVMLYPVM